MATITDLKKIETSTLQKILEACEKSFPKELSLEEFYGEGQTTWSIPEIGIFNKDTKSKNDLLDFVENLTDTKNIRLAYATIFEEVENRKLQNKEAPRPKDQTRTTLSEEELKQLQEEQIAHETKRKETILKSDQKVHEATKRKQEIAQEKTKKQNQTVKIDEKNRNEKEQIDKIKKIVVVPIEEIHTVTLSGQEKEKLFNLKQAVNNDPATVQRIIEKKITQSVKISSDPQIIKSITPEIISKTAFSITQNIEALPNFTSISEIPTIYPVIHPSSPFIAISNVNDGILGKLISNNVIRREVVNNAQTIAIMLDTERSVNVAGTNAAIGSENITSIFYGDDNITKFQISKKQEEERDEGIEIDPKEIYRQSKDINGIWRKIFNKTTTVKEISIPTSTYINYYLPTPNATLAAKTSSLVIKALPVVGAVYGFKQGLLLSQLTRVGTPLLMNPQIIGMLTSGSIDMSIISSGLIMSSPTQLVVGKFAIGFTTGITSQGHQVAYAGVSFGQKFTGIMGIKSGTQVVVGTATSQTGAKVAIGASKFLTKALALFSSLSAWATAGLSLIASWLLGKIIEKIDWKKVKENFLPIVVIGGGLLIGGPVGLSMLVGGGLFAARALRKTAKIGAFLATLGAVLGGIAIRIATPIIVTLLIIPPTVAFFMFIINSGAYIVPPSELTFGNIINPYMEVTKTPVPTGPFENSELPLTVEYKITIRSKKGTLENINLNYECGVVKTGPKIGCPPTSPVIPSSLADIKPGETYSFSYSQTYMKGSFEDTLIFDTITVTADTEEQKGISSSASAGVKIGNPPDNCPSIWPVDGKHMITQTPNGGYSHRGVEAMDIGELPIGSIVKTTHSGIATTKSAGGYGRYVDITSNCGGKEIITRYAHLSSSVPDGEVTLGQKIGTSGYGGSGPHLHYEFRGGIQMFPPFIPKTIIRGCSSDTGLCGYIP